MADQKIGGMSVENTQLVLDTVRYLRQAGFLPQAGMQTSPLPDTNPILFRNDSGETIPAYGCMQVTGTLDVTDSYNYIQVTKPVDETGANGFYLFNGPNTVADGKYGTAQQGHVVRALSDGTTVTAATQSRGPVAGQWYIGTTANTWVVAGADDVATDIIRILFGSNNYRGFAVTPGGGIAACSGSATPWTPGVATCSLAEWVDVSGTWKIQTCSPTVSLSVYNTSPAMISASSLIQFKIVGGKAVVDVGDCV